MLGQMIGLKPLNLVCYAAGLAIGNNVQSKLASNPLNSQGSADFAGIISGLGITMTSFVVGNYLLRKMVATSDTLGDLPKQGRIAAILANENFKCIANKKQGAWLVANPTGKLSEVNSMCSKVWQIFSNYISWNTEVIQTSAVINSISQKLFTAFCEEDLKSEVFNPTSEMYRNSVSEVSKYCRAVEQLGAPYWSCPLKSGPLSC